MYCPACGQERTSNVTNYCSRCGFLLTGAADLLQMGGVIPVAAAPKGWKARSKRNRGLKQGLFIFLLTFLIVPLIAIITIAVHAPPFAVVIAAILLTIGGLLRMAYALMFESTDVGTIAAEEQILLNAPGLNDRTFIRNLPPQQTFPAGSYVSPATGNWMDTNDLHPASVVDGTTRLLEPSDHDQ